MVKSTTSSGPRSTGDVTKTSGRNPVHAERSRPTRRDAASLRLAEAGRELSDAAVHFHSVVAERLGMGPSEWKLLGLLAKLDAPTAGRLAEHTGLAPASVTGLLDRLEARGWIRRSRDPQDRRRVVVELEDGAGEAFQPLFEGLLSRLSSVYARYTVKELDAFSKFLAEIASAQRDATAELSRRPSE